MSPHSFRWMSRCCAVVTWSIDVTLLSFLYQPRKQNCLIEIRERRLTMAFVQALNVVTNNVCAGHAPPAIIYEGLWRAGWMMWHRRSLGAAAQNKRQQGWHRASRPWCRPTRGYQRVGTYGRPWGALTALGRAVHAPLVLFPDHIFIPYYIHWVKYLTKSRFVVLNCIPSHTSLYNILYQMFKSNSNMYRHIALYRSLLVQKLGPT